MTVRYDNVCARGVPCPTELKEAYGRHRLRMVAELSQTVARESCGAGPNLTCRSLCRDNLAYAYGYIS